MIEPAEDQLPESGGVEPAALALARREHDHETLRAEPPRGEHERRGRGDVEPLGVIDQTQDGALLCCRREQRQHSGRDEEAVRAAARSQTESAFDRVALRLGQLRQVPDDRPHQAMEAGEIEIRLALHSGHLQDRQLVGALRRTLQQRSLARPRLAAQDECAAVAPRSAVEEAINHRALVVATNEPSGGPLPRCAAHLVADMIAHPAAPAKRGGPGEASREIAGTSVAGSELHMRHDVVACSIRPDELTAALLLHHEREHAGEAVAEFRKDEDQH